MVHPVAQRLPVHTACFGGLGPRPTFQHQGNRQQAPDNRAIAAPRCLTAQVYG
jgi:hypothetical protein